MPSKRDTHTSGHDQAARTSGFKIVGFVKGNSAPLDEVHVVMRKSMRSDRVEMSGVDFGRKSSVRLPLSVKKVGRGDMRPDVLMTPADVERAGLLPRHLAAIFDEVHTQIIEYKGMLVFYVSDNDTPAPEGLVSASVPDETSLYSLAVGARVTELVDQLVEAHPGIASTPPEVLAETLVDVAIDAEADRSELADLLAPFWSAKRTQQALGGITRSAMLDRRKTGSLLGVKTTDGDIFYPVAQFETHEGKVRVKPDLRRFMMALRDRDPWTVAILLHTPADELDGRTPLDWVRHGRDPESLAAYARLVNVEFSR